MSSPTTSRARKPRRRYRTRAWSRSGRLDGIDEAGVDEGCEIGHALDLFQRQHVVGVNLRFLDFLRAQPPGQLDIGDRGFNRFLLLPSLAVAHRDRGSLV